MNRPAVTAAAILFAVLTGAIMAQLTASPDRPQTGAPAQFDLAQVRGIRTHAQTPALDVDQRGAGPVAIFRVARTPVAVLENNGNLTLSKFGAIVQTVTPTRTSTPTSTNTPTSTSTSTSTPTATP